MPLDWQRDAELTDIHAVNDQHVWVVGERGLILHSMDGGKNWQQRSLKDLRFVNDQLKDKELFVYAHDILSIFLNDSNYSHLTAKWEQQWFCVPV